MHRKLRILVVASAVLAVLAVVTSSAAGTASTASKIVYTAGTSFQSDVYVVSSKGGRATRLTKNHALDLNPTWSRDGKQIAFESNLAQTGATFVLVCRLGTPGGKWKPVR